MRVLVACEFSGVVRRAFQARGHFAMSCDLLPTEDGSQNHCQGDALDAAYGSMPWDLMIAHPPCTYLANSGAKHLYNGMKKENGINPERWANMEAAAAFFKALWDCPIPRIAIENPIMHGHGKKLIGVEQAQTIQPWQYGHGEIKATCLWLKGLPKLVPTGIVDGRHARVHLATPSPDRWKERSRTLPGIAAAFAGQWSEVLATAEAAE
jgi:hypothetical protein